MSEWYKLVIIGDSGVGKTTIFKRYIIGTKDFHDIQPTIAATPIFSKSLNESGNKFQIWDTAGQEKFKALVPLYYRDSIGCICVFDVTDRKSFDNIKIWIKLFLEHCSHKISSPLILLLGNKTDRPINKWKVDLSDILILTKSYECEYLPVSGLWGGNSLEFDKCLQKLYDKIPHHEREITTIELEKSTKITYDTCYSSC
jgi:small GTP-binding protein